MTDFLLAYLALAVSFGLLAFVQLCGQALDRRSPIGREVSSVFDEFPASLAALIVVIALLACAGAAAALWPLHLGDL